MNARHQGDLLEGAEALATFTGRVLHNAELRTKVLDREGHSLPVLCVDLECDSGIRGHIHVEKVYPFGQQAQAEAAARGLRAGMQVTVETPLAGLRLVIPNAVQLRAADTPSSPAHRKDQA